MKDYDAIAHKLPLISSEGWNDWPHGEVKREQDVKNWRIRVAAILRKHDEAEAGGELLSDIIETSRMVQHDFNGRTGMYWDEWVAHLDEAFSSDTSRPAPTDEKPLGVIRDMADQLDRWANESRSGGWSTHQVDPMRRKADELRRFVALAREAPKDESKEGGA